LKEKIHWLGHDGFRIDAEKTIYIDPYQINSGKRQTFFSSPILIPIIVPLPIFQKFGSQIQSSLPKKIRLKT